MSRDFAVVALIVGLLSLQVAFVLFIQPKAVTVRYNCDIAEISPDIPIKVKEECRKLKSGRI